MSIRFDGVLFMLIFYGTFVKTGGEQWLPEPRKCHICTTELAFAHFPGNKDCRFQPPEMETCPVNVQYCVTIVITDTNDNVISFSRDCSPSERPAGCETVHRTQNKRCISVCDSDGCNNGSRADTINKSMIRYFFVFVLLAIVNVFI